jgi:class 3 adenylate cyclase
MQEAIRQISVETGEDLGITVGINSGPMVAGSIGSRKRLEFTVLGDTVNVASRLQGLAERGQIIIGQGTADLLDKRLVELQPTEPLKVKNRKQPVNAFKVVRLR